MPEMLGSGLKSYDDTQDLAVLPNTPWRAARATSPPGPSRAQPALPNLDRARPLLLRWDVPVGARSSVDLQGHEQRSSALDARCLACLRERSRLSTTNQAQSISGLERSFSSFYSSQNSNMARPDVDITPRTDRLHNIVPSPISEKP